MTLAAPHLIGVSLALTLALSAGAFAQGQGPGTADRAEPLSVSASYSDAGPYGVLWIAYLASKDRVSVLRRAIGEARFFELRADIAPATQQFHRPTTG